MILLLGRDWGVFLGVGSCGAVLEVSLEEVTGLELSVGMACGDLPQKSISQKGYIGG